jgi:hypothetical protein
MLRRPATTITLTAGDVEQFEKNRERKLWEQQQAEKQATAQAIEASKEPAQTVPMKSKKERIMGGGGQRGN